jgi:ribosomal protein L11 methylase PrmA
LVNLLEQGLSYLLTNQGILILSGILEEQTIDVEAAIEASGLRLEEKRQIADWVALVVKKLG